MQISVKSPPCQKNFLNLTLTVISLYVHGGRDLKEGSIASMWRLNLSRIHQTMEEENNEINFEWEQV